MGRTAVDDLEDDRDNDDRRVGRGSRLRLINEHGVAIDEETDDYDSEKRTSPCAVTCCGFLVGALVTAAVSAAVLFFVLTFAISYQGLDNGLCRGNEIGVGRVCVSCPSRNASPDEAARMCRASGADVASFGTIKILVERVAAFAPIGSSDFLAVSRMSESTTTCVKATANGAASVDCPAKAAVVCQRPRPLGRLQESIRKTRVTLGAEPEDMYSKHAFMFANSATR